MKKNSLVRYGNSPITGAAVEGPKNEYISFGSSKKRTTAIICKPSRAVVLVIGLMGTFFLLDSSMLAIIHHFSHSSLGTRKSSELQIMRTEVGHEENSEKIMHKRLLNLALSALSKNKIQHESDLLVEPKKPQFKWKPCAHEGSYVPEGQVKTTSGFILVSANGGLNQQRVAVCNAVAVAALLNATLVLPKFLYSSVWRDRSQFGDIYQEDFFINYLKNDVRIVKELPSHLQSLDMEAIGSLVTDMDIMKESKPIYFKKVILPLLQRNGVVHFLGFGNRLAFDPLPSDLQRLRCKCNFHALKFVPKIQKIGSILVRRLRKYDSRPTELDKQLLGKFLPSAPNKAHIISEAPVRHLALHMRFEIDMVAYSLCDFGGGKMERKELQAYREIHFPVLVTEIKKNKTVSPEESRSLGRCPLTPEEAALMLSALGFSNTTYIYIAGSQIYGGQQRMLPFKRLYPNLIMKEDILSPNELAPFMNYSSQLAALDFIACATADVFAMTDSGSQFASLVNGYRIYHGSENAATLRPNKKQFAKILSENKTMHWNVFEGKVRKMIKQNQIAVPRGVGRSVYRLPSRAEHGLVFNQKTEKKTEPN